MNLCSDGHDEVCFDGRYCPACAIQVDLSKAESAIESLKEELDAVKQERNALEEEIAARGEVNP